MQQISKDTKRIIKQVHDTMKSKNVTVYQLWKDGDLPKQTAYDLINKNTLEKHVNYLVSVADALGLTVTLTEK